MYSPLFYASFLLSLVLFRLVVSVLYKLNKRSSSIRPKLKSPKKISPSSREDSQATLLAASDSSDSLPLSNESSSDPMDDPLPSTQKLLSQPDPLDFKERHSLALEALQNSNDLDSFLENDLYVKSLERKESALPGLAQA